jgi:methanogenic corrinoid protein MtbC1
MSREEEIEEIRKILSEQGIKLKIIPTLYGFWITIQCKDKLIDTYIDDYFDMINE